MEPDHKPLQYILNRPYDLKVKYRPGVELSVANALSRSYLPETTETLIPDLEVNEVHLTTHFTREVCGVATSHGSCSGYTSLKHNNPAWMAQKQGRCTKCSAPVLGLQG